MKQRILVVEDETAIASVLDALLTEAGYEVTLATDGVQGLQAFHRQSFSLILLAIALTLSVRMFAAWRASRR